MDETRVLLVTAAALLAELYFVRRVKVPDRTQASKRREINGIDAMIPLCLMSLDRCPSFGTRILFLQWTFAFRREQMAGDLGVICGVLEKSGYR